MLTVEKTKINKKEYRNGPLKAKILGRRPGLVVVGED